MSSVVSQPSDSVPTRNASLMGSSIAAVSPTSPGRSVGALDAAPLELLEQVAQALREHRDLDLLEGHGHDPGPVAGLEEERPVAGRADRAGDEAVGGVEEVAASGHQTAKGTGSTLSRPARTTEW